MEGEADDFSLVLSLVAALDVLRRMLFLSQGARDNASYLVGTETRADSHRG